jgi:hypothetical protein
VSPSDLLEVREDTHVKSIDRKKTAGVAVRLLAILVLGVWLATPVVSSAQVYKRVTVDKTQTCPPPKFPRGHVAKSYNLCGEERPGCPKNPPSHMQTVTVSNKGAFVSHLQVWYNHQDWTCGYSGPVLATGSPSVDKSLLAGESWSQTYDSTANVMTVTFYINGASKSYCAEKSQIDGGPDNVQITASGTTFNLACNGLVYLLH